MLDKSIPNYKITMKYFGDAGAIPEPALPGGYYFKAYERGDNVKWAEIEHAVTEFSSVEKALEYYGKEFLFHEDLLSDRQLFIVNQEGKYAATATAWFHEKDGARIGMLHWVAATPKFQNLGLGKAVIQKTMTLFPRYEPGRDIYLHTQTWSHKAVALYSRFGFRMMKKETFGQTINEYDKAVEVLRGCVNSIIFDQLTREAV